MQRTLSEEIFLGMLCLERKRAERSSKKFLLLLLDLELAIKAGRHSEISTKVVRAVDAARRDTDPAGWYKQESVLGIMFTELGTTDDVATLDTLLEKIHGALLAELNSEGFQLVRISVHLFPSEPNEDDSSKTGNPTFYPDLFHEQEAKKLPLLLKRIIDIAGSIAAVILFSPL
ncbi:MAG: hypothetical protein ACREBQ_05195, partial [Nitrososphaerales archaeon]